MTLSKSHKVWFECCHLKLEEVGRSWIFDLQENSNILNVITKYKYIGLALINSMG